MNQLFLDTSFKMDKVALAEFKLSNNADLWPQELLQELIKFHPYIANYEVTPVMENIDAERGYGLGYFLISNKTTTPPIGIGTESLRALNGVKEARVLVVIKESKAKPFDVFIGPDGKSYPLNERRLNSALYRPNLLDAMGKRPPSALIGDQLFPPHERSMYNNNSELGYNKTGSLLKDISNTISLADINKIGYDLKENEKLAYSAFCHPVVKPILEHLSTVRPTTSQDISKIASSKIIKPNVIQLTRLENSYILKMANSEMFSPTETEADRATMVEQVGSDMVESADRDGSAIVSTNPVVSETAEDESISDIKEFGEYRVKDSDGKEHMGWVFPIVRDFDGTSLPLAIFTNGTTGALQSKIVGSPVGRGTNIIRGKPEGYGFFYRVTSSGGAIAFIPLEIKHPLVDQFGKAYMCETIEAEPIIIRPVAGFNGIQKIDEGHFAVPGDVRWAPLGHTVIKLIDDANLFVKESSLQKRGSSVSIKSDGRYWSFSGPCVEKLAHEDKNSLSGSNAYFLSCALGMQPLVALNQLIKAAKQGPITVNGCRKIKLARDILSESRKEAEQLINKLPKKQYLLKEAVSLQDIGTIDKVLSLGFINPANVDIFISYIPDLEKAVSKLAELLVAIRLGLSDISETACKSAMEKLDETVNGLKNLMHNRIGVN